MAAKASIPQLGGTAIDSTQNQFVVEGTVALTGTYPTNGDTIDFSQLGVPSSGVPLVEFYEATPAPGPPSGYAFIFVPGTNQTNGLITLFNGTTQASTAAYSSILTVTGFALRFRAWFASGV